VRTLTNVELGFVSGGESPCYALKGNAGCSPSTPGMSARQVSSALQAGSTAAQAASLKGGKSAIFWGAVSVVLDAGAWVADAVAGDE
jgi:hypothetical protein